LIGALVGGSLSEELIPISIGDLFVVKKKAWIHFQKEKMTNSQDREGFYRAREALSKGTYICKYIYIYIHVYLYT
jgi:hypothetical protein